MTRAAAIALCLLLTACSVEPPADQTSQDTAPTTTHTAPLAGGPGEPVAEPEAPPIPHRVEQVRAAPAEDASLLARWAIQPEAEPKVRYAALRRLEQLEAEETVPTALLLLHDEEPQLKVNAVAVLARSDDPRAKRAIRHLEPRYKRAAELLALKEGR